MTPETAPRIELNFAHNWTAEILPARPLIFPSRHFVYPRQAEEVERGALEVLIRPVAGPNSGNPFLATCALGFRDPSVPTGLWSAPRPEEICVVSGGYAYVIDTTRPEQFTMVRYRPVMAVRAAVAEGLLLFAGHRSILAWGVSGEQWESEPLSDEGVMVGAIENGTLRGMGWEMRTDKETPFALNLRTGERVE